ncbi:MAG TPA: reverse transcriptase family protein [Gemmataceae bacterium]|nr:reverse transcriptase family protein [Gemmataceae bacterium]
MSAQSIIARNLASAFLAGVWSLEGLVRRGREACGKRPSWLRPLARRVLARFAEPEPRPNVDSLSTFLLGDPGFCRAWTRKAISLHRVYWVAPSMIPTAGAPASWTLPALTTTTALAEWLRLTPSELDWFADVQRRERLASPGPLRHYTYRWRTTRRKVRLLEVPKSRLKGLQHRLLRGLLDVMPPHEAAHAYRRGRSIGTLVAPHAGRGIVVHLDLQDFFPSIRSARVHALFHTAGYPTSVARLLTGLCTNSIPLDILEKRPSGGRPDSVVNMRRRLAFPHLPQGAPTSPALANLCAYRFDCRLAGLARALDASYTRYADDLIFSGGETLERSVRRFHVHVCRIALEEGFEVNTRKSHFMRQGVRQQVAGVVLNVRPNVRRVEYDRLKAILTNCARHGPHSQNREGHANFRAHLAGRIGYVAMLHAERGRRLRQMFDEIRWTDDGASQS